MPSNRSTSSSDLRTLGAEARAKRREAIVAWLIANYDLWPRVKGPDTIDRRALVKAMKAAGVIAPTTYHRDIKLDTYMREAGTRLARAERINGVR